MMDANTSAPPRDVRDVYGRRYRIGEDARDLTGHSRQWQRWAAWACMVAISPLQYSFGSAALGLQAEGTIEGDPWAVLDLQRRAVAHDFCHPGALRLTERKIEVGAP